MNSSRHRKITQNIFLLLCLMGIIVFAVLQNKVDLKNDVLSNISIKTTDESITITWNVPTKTNITKVLIEIKDNNERIIKEVNVLPTSKKYKYNDGELNNSYIVTVNSLHKDGTKIENCSEKRLFLDLDDLPDLPTMNIATKSGNDPTANYIEAKEGLWGTTSIDNEYEKGTMTYAAFGKNIESKLKIKIRGNTSSLGDKKPYKIVLDNALDLTNSGSEYVHKEWVLLNTGTTLNNFLGEVIGKYTDVEWVPHEIYINVFLNGDYKGIYTLCEAVSQESSHNLVSKNGYIIENDAYFWNANWIYFKLYDQIEQMGYTFKYPDIKSSEDTRIEEVYHYMQNAVDLSNENNQSAWECVDLNSVVSFMLARDLTNNYDAGGTNIYYFLNNFDSNSEDKMLKMGPLWDFDSAFRGSNYTNEHGFSEQHNSVYIPFVDNGDFKQNYIEKWYEISDGTLDYINDSLDELYKNQREAINQSRYLNSLRWTDGTYRSLEEEINLAKKWLSDQVNWLNENVKELK